MSRTEGKDYYSILGAEREASRAEIERLYKRLAKNHHPDRGGDEEEMKRINEAYRVLRDDALRLVYDAEHDQLPAPSFVPSVSPSAQADAFGGRMAGSLLSLIAGLTLLFLVRFHYVVFLWPLALLAVSLIVFAIWMAHAALGYAREGSAPTNPLRRFVWAQETAFWSLVCGGVYVVYLLLTVM
ncbi:MAG: J domain-containing protein [Pyrinomonadaceae bacterium]|jgi:curved DNA-binding protein CbpA|nr:J domain-containing protein [Pyrinomonadaceae bacterium]